MNFRVEWNVRIFDLIVIRMPPKPCAMKQSPFVNVLYTTDNNAPALYPWEPYTPKEVQSWKNDFIEIPETR